MKQCFNVVVIFTLTFFAFDLLAENASNFPLQPWGNKSAIKSLQSLAIQERGRVKPFDTFARESVQLVTGKQGFSSWSPVELTLSWFANPDIWRDAEIVSIKNKEVKRTLSLDGSKKYFSPSALIQNGEFLDRIEENFRKRQRDEDFTELDQKIAAIEMQIATFQGISTGANWFIVPNRVSKEGNWISLVDLLSPEKSIALGFSEDEVAFIMGSMRAALSSYGNRDSTQFAVDIKALKTAIISTLPDKSFYPTDFKLYIETHYNNFRPFQVAWILYLFAFVLLLLSFGFAWKGFRISGLALSIFAFAVHGYGFVLRFLIAGRPPVTNMYETVIWVTWGVFLFSLILYAIYKNRLLVTVASAVAVIGLILADNIPTVLDPTINPLVPVLRDNFWLTIHVLTINLGYAGMALAAGLGNVVMGRVLFGAPTKEKIASLSRLTYRAMQIGLVLLTAGTILGGVWADQSWGRFWGWDPKEVWALIAILTYLAILHGRYAGWLKDFGVAACAALGFLTIMMAWYGVNYILGVGLHSYGFGTGGSGYVLIYALLQIGFVIASAYKWKKYTKLLF